MTKHKQNSLFGNLDVLITNDFYQMPSSCDSWVFHPINDAIHSLGICFWQDKIKCDELCQVMQQQETQFIQILNQFKKSVLNTTRY